MKKGKGSKNSGGRLLPNSLKIISSCIKTVSTNASTVVRSAGASVAASISASPDDRKDQVTWAGFDKLELGPTTFKHVLLLGYQNGFQVFDVEDATNFSELVSKRDGPVTFLQMLPIPAKSESGEGFRSSHPLLLVVAGDELNSLSPDETRFHLGRDGTVEHQSLNYANSPTAVRFYSLRSNVFVQALKFRSAVCMVRCSSRIVAVGLATQICCVDAITLEIKFSVLTYPMPQVGGQGSVGVNFGYGPMALGPRWLAYATDNPLVSNTGRLSPRNLTPSPGVSPSTSPGGGSLMARYAMESSIHLANGIINLGDKGYKTLTRYCPDLLPESPSSPVSPGSGWKVGRLTASEVENAGMVVVKDFVSRAVISQFRAHTSPISALCFDPSGTLLVTASVHGNNINIFRIIPSCMHASGNQTCDWSSAHVHLYKLHRGITPAIIQDISFSHYSQWVAIISNKGTCHIYVLSPFGGDAGFETLNPHGEDQSLYPVLTLPWWSTSSFSINQNDSPPPPPVTLSVVSRIKDNNSGLLSSVSNAASSAAGKVSVPSGAVAAVFHNSISRGFQDIQPRANPLEHLLVYTPSGYVVQYELLPLIGVELSDNGLRTRSNSYMHTPDDELRLKVEPVQWWDVCRRSDWPEREESISGTTFARQEVAEIIGNSYKTKLPDVNETIRGKQLVKVDSVKPHDRSHWYLSNVEVQINSGRIPIWQKSKICFYLITPPRINGYVGGELEIEQVPFHEVEIKRKDLLPVFDHFHSIKSNWNERGLWGGTYPNASSLGLHQVREKVTEETVICHSKPASLSSTESSDGGGSSRRMENFLDLDQVNVEKSMTIPNFPPGSSRRMENFLDLDQVNVEKSMTHVSDSMNMFTQERRGSTNVESALLRQKYLRSELIMNTYSLADGSNKNGLSSEEHNVPSEATVTDTSVMQSDDLISTAEHFDSAMNVNEGGSKPSRLQNLVEFEPLFQEGYCKALDVDGHCTLAEEVTDALDCSEKQCRTENPNDDDMLGGMFSFSEEG